MNIEMNSRFVDQAMRLENNTLVTDVSRISNEPPLRKKLKVSKSLYINDSPDELY
jgi:hypothetical protein